MLGSLVVAAVMSQLACSNVDSFITLKPWLVGYGDTTMYGAATSGQIPQLMTQQLAPGWLWINQGVPDNLASQISTRVVAGVSTACLGQSCDYCVIEGGAMSIRRSSPIPTATILAEMSTAVDAASTSCRFVVWVGLLPFGGYVGDGNGPAMQQLVKDYNAAMIPACTARPAVRCIFPYAIFEDSAQPTFLAPAYNFGDGFSLNPAGGAEYARQILLKFRPLNAMW